MPDKVVILIVDDESDVRAFARQTLVEAGYFVLTAADAETALKFMRIVIVDVLFTDIVMPNGMNGCQLARLARAISPSVKIVCTSGFAWARENASDICSAMLAKPYQPARLLAEVARALSV
ncbi:MAG: multi-sensor hybrid histidine kinase [Rhodospirillales bacterium]|nr:multi-sensor hybrid histidine kinase [Rhodospirillales bacterium]